MYRDNTLLPQEAVRLTALGVLAEGERRYADLASSVRHFTGHMVGPSLDLVGTPIELLKLEGLVESVGDANAEDDAALRITDAGLAELRRLLCAGVRPPISDVNKLIIALKVRFLHLLDPEDRRLQAQVLVEMNERELARLEGLRERHADDGGRLVDWLALEIEQTAARLEWFRELEQEAGGA